MNFETVQLALFTISIGLENWHGCPVIVERAWFWNGYTQVLSYKYI
jgi:hypothetical protein